MHSSRLASRPSLALAIAVAMAVACALGAASVAQAQSTPPGGATVYRCPGPPVLYTDSLSAQEARERGCKTIDGAPITVLQAPKPRPVAAAGNAAAPSAAPASRGAEGRVDPAEQRGRDSDRRRILSDELRTEEGKLAELQREFNAGEPERRGDERNFAKYQQRVAEMRAAISRREADVAALKRELGKLPTP
jgi:hypothetical protein